MRTNGYGVFWSAAGIWSAHRLAYELHVGPIAPRFTIDHLCRNRDCVNPKHLEAGSHSQNIIRAVRGTTCRRGHALEGNAVPRGRSAQLVCLACKRLHGARWRARRKAKAAVTPSPAPETRPND